MKLVEYLNGFPKDLVYDMYMNIVYDIKDYGKITKKNMINAIIEQYNESDYLYDICTAKELEFLKLIINKKLKPIDLPKYRWEIENLHNKCILSIENNCFEEMEDLVLKAIKTYNKNKQMKEMNDYLMAFMIGYVKTFGNMLSSVFIDLVSSLTHTDKEFIDAICGSPLFHYYCDFYCTYIYDFDKREEFVFYRKYFDLLPDLDEARKKYGVAFSGEFILNDYIDTFYYGFPIRKKVVKKMYDTINTNTFTFYANLIDEARVLNNYYLLDAIIDDEELLKIIKQALEELPCSAMNGVTPKEYIEIMKKEKEFENNMNKTEQINACLTEKDADLFYKLYFSLMEYVNKKGNIIPNLKKIYKKNNMNPQYIYQINEYLFENIYLIDEYIKDNPNKFNNDELKIIEGFKKGKHGLFLLAGFDEEYTKFTSAEEKVYMVKGIRCNIDEIVDFDIPCGVETTLLPFKDNIIINGIIGEIPVKIDINMKNNLINDANTFIKYYHF